jgi:hypothetical protein
MGTTANLAEAGRKMLGAQRLRAARQAREARVKFWRVAIVTSFFAVVLGGGMSVGAVVLVGKLRDAASAEESNARHQTAHIRRPLLDGTFCRDIVIDNQTSKTIGDKIERCDGGYVEPAFRPKAEFTWGGK